MGATGDESVCEALQARVAAALAATKAAEQKEAEATPPQPREEGTPRGKAPKADLRKGPVFEAMAKSAARSVGSQ